MGESDRQRYVISYKSVNLAYTPPRLASPDAVMVTKGQINLWKEGKGVVDVVKSSMEEEETKAMYEGENMGEGLKAFNEVSCYRNWFS